MLHIYLHYVDWEDQPVQLNLLICVCVWLWLIFQPTCSDKWVIWDKQTEGKHIL